MPTRPHIVVIMPDQMRADCLSCAKHPVVQTPHLDRLAAQGTRFVRAYSNSPICMPARTTALTGEYCHTHGQWSNYGRTPLRLDSYARRLRDDGYRTCYVGKSHFYSHTRGDHLSAHVPFMNELGWQDVYETTGPWATVTTDSIMTDHWAEIGCLEMFRNDYARRRAAGPVASIWPSPMPDGEHMEDFVGQQAVAQIESYDREEPLLLFVGFGGPHEPWDPPPAWGGMYDRARMPAPLPAGRARAWLPPAAAAYQQGIESDRPEIPEEYRRAIQALYFGKVSHVDYWVGRIMQALRARRMWGNTAMVFWSDHGEMLCDKNRVHKAVFFESAVRVPMIVRQPRQAQPGATSRALISHVDIFPTILELAGCAPQESAFGSSLLPLVGKPRAKGPDAVFSEIDDLTMIRDQRYKAVFNSSGELLQLFDLKDDPTESLNMAGKPGTKTTVSALRERLLAWHLGTQRRQTE
jgi:arylsulfatase